MCCDGFSADVAERQKQLSCCTVIDIVIIVVCVCVCVQGVKSVRDEITTSSTYSRGQLYRPPGTPLTLNSLVK